MTFDPHRGSSALDRRELMLGAGAIGLGMLPILAAACGQPRPAAAGRGRLIAGNSCPATPPQTEGPFYFDPRLVRADIAEGRPGVPLRMRLQIVDARDCAAFGAARVDIWHCDAGGQYSGYDSEGSRGATFLRGTQIADARGVATFRTVYPGWYGGRATHIHCKAWARNGRELTAQVYFPDPLSEAVYGHSAYSGRPRAPRLRNGDDELFRRGGEASLAEIARTPSGYEGAIVIAIA